MGILCMQAQNLSLVWIAFHRCGKLPDPDVYLPVTALAPPEPTHSTAYESTHHVGAQWSCRWEEITSTTGCRIMASAETLSLPLPSDSNRHSLGEAPANKPHSDSSGTHRILLVDDDADIRSLVRAFLEAEGYEVFSCGDAHRAHTLFSTRDDIDLLLTDVRMPEISGPELAQTLSALRPGLPVLFMSGAILDDDFEQKLASNNWRFLAKPFLVPTLLSAVHELIAITEQTRKAASQ